MILSEPPPLAAESYGVAPEHAFTPACLAVQGFFEKQEVMPLDRVHMFAGSLVLMEITVAQMRSKASRIPSLASRYLQQIVKEEMAISAESNQLELSEDEINDAIAVAIGVLGTIKKNPTDTITPFLLLDQFTQKEPPLENQKELVFA